MKTETDQQVIQMRWLVTRPTAYEMETVLQFRWREYEWSDWYTVPVEELKPNAAAKSPHSQEEQMTDETKPEMFGKPEIIGYLPFKVSHKVWGWITREETITTKMLMEAMNEAYETGRRSVGREA